MTQIEKDIETRILDKLSLWLTDSFALCEMANIRVPTATAMVMRALLYCLISGLMQKGANKADLVEIVSVNWDLLKEIKSKAGWN